MSFGEIKSRSIKFARNGYHVAIDSRSYDLQFVEVTLSTAETINGRNDQFVKNYGEVVEEVMLAEVEGLWDLQNRLRDRLNVAEQQRRRSIR